MVKYTNIGLVKHAEKALALKTKYMWGGLLRLIEKQYDILHRVYGIDAAKGYTTARWNELETLKNKGIYGVDCVGLIKSYYLSGKADGGTGSPDYGKYPQYPDVPAGTMYNLAKVKGKISTMPEIPGLIVYSKSHPHVGIYIGNGYTIESTLGARGDGVVKRKLDNFWEYWFECPYIEYVHKDTHTDIKSVTLQYNAVVRSQPSERSQKLSRLTAGSKCVIIDGTQTKDPVSGNVYVQLAGDMSQWIIEKAIRKAGA